MSASPSADLLVRRLHELGVHKVFGYPGGQLTPVYDAIHRHGRIRHYLARHEQAAAFMADGYARATGRPGVCLAVCGPGVYNTATPLASAQTDSVPVLVISGQVPLRGLGLRSGYYHENDQLTASVPFTKWRVRAEKPEDVVPLLDNAWAALTDGRPGPVLFEVPLDVLRAENPAATWPDVPPPPSPRPPRPEDTRWVADRLRAWKRPLLLAGGGVIAAGAESHLVKLAERLGAPVHYTPNGKCALPGGHPLNAGLPWLRLASDATATPDDISPLFAAADGLLAVGCRFSQVGTGSWNLKPPAEFVHVDIDPEEIGRHYPVTRGVQADARLTLEALLAELPAERREPWGAKPARPTWRLPGLDLLAPLRRVLPADAIVSADVTRLAYMLMADFPLDSPRAFLHPTGAVAMGYGLPAALGAKAAFPERRVVAVAGDGGFLMSGMELATAVQERLAVVVVLVNDNSLTLIRSTQQRRYANRFIAVDLRNPDFGLFARAFGVDYWRADTDAAFEAAMGQALASDRPALVEVRPGDAIEVP